MVRHWQTTAYCPTHQRRSCNAPTLPHTLFKAIVCACSQITLYKVSQNEASERLLFFNFSRNLALDRIFSVVCVIFLDDDDNGWDLKKLSTSSALSDEQKAPQQLTIQAAIRDGEALPIIPLIRPKLSWKKFQLISRPSRDDLPTDPIG